MINPLRAFPVLLSVGLAFTGTAGAGSLSLNDAVTQVRDREDGRVLRAETRREESREEHQVRILTNEGRVRQYRIDASTGAVLPPGGRGGDR